jgi:hypothetical protein
MVCRGTFLLSVVSEWCVIRGTDTAGVLRSVSGGVLSALDSTLLPYTLVVLLTLNGCQGPYYTVHVALVEHYTQVQ